MKQIEAYFSEFSLLRGSFQDALPKVVNDFEKPDNRRHALLPEIDLKLIDIFTAELATTEHVLTKNQRKLIYRLKHYKQRIEDLNIKVKNIEWERSYTKEKGHEFRAYTAELLINAVQVQFFLIKQENEGDKFNFSGDYTALDCAKICCLDCGITYDAQAWEKIKFFAE